MRQVTYSFTPADADLFALAQTTAGAGDLVLTGAAPASQARVTLYSAGDLSAVTFTVYGTNANAASFSEAIVGPNADTVTTLANFATVTRVAASAAVRSNATVGIAAAAETAWLPLDVRRALKGVAVELSSGASLTYEVQYGARKLVAAGESGLAVQAVPDTVLTDKTTSSAISAFVPFPLIRVKVTSYVSGTLTLRVNETFS
jgi:hypothetical protein